MVPGITLRTRGGANFACSGPIFKKSDSMVFYGAKELRRPKIAAPTAPRRKSARATQRV